MSARRIRSTLAALALAVAVAAPTVAVTVASAVPLARGAVDHTDVHGAVATVEGWAWDGSSDVTTVSFTDTVRGTTTVVGSTTTWVQRGDVARAVPGAPRTTGYSVDLTLPDGAHHLCATIGGTTIGCAVVTTKRPTTHDAIGALDSIVRDRDGIRVRGWVWDPDTTAGLDSVVVTDETGRTPIRLAEFGNGITRRDVSRTHPGAYSTTGFDDSVMSGVPGGDRRICVRTGSVEDAAGTPLGCRTVTHVGDPAGRLDTVASYGVGNLTIGGWAFDWSAPSTAVHLYDNGRFLMAVTTSGSRSDVSAAYPGSPSTNAYFVRRTGIASGSHTLCAYAINTPTGNNPQLGCKTVTVS